MPKKSAKTKDPAKKISERLFEFTGLDGIKYKLTLKEREFCHLYLQIKGNGTEAAYEVYKCKNRLVAAGMARNMLQKVHISAYINSQLEAYGFNDDNVDKQHNFLINQFGDLPSKAKGIDMYRKMKGQYAPDRIIHSIDEDSVDAKLEEVRARKRALEAETGGGGASTDQTEDSN